VCVCKVMFTRSLQSASESTFNSAQDTAQVYVHVRVCVGGWGGGEVVGFARMERVW
jgi:hypothetical protein